MKPRVPSTEHRERPSHQTPRRPHDVFEAAGGDPLATLSAAGLEYARSVNPGRVVPRPLSITIALIAGALVGGAILALSPLEHRCVATLRLRDHADEGQLARCRKELLDHTWGEARTLAKAGFVLKDWSVHSPAPDLLQLSIVHTDRPTGLMQVRRIAQDYCRRLDVLAEAERSTPSAAETILAEPLSKLRTRLAEARRRVDEATAAVPVENPSAQRRSLVEQWRLLVSDFTHGREDLAAAQALHRRLAVESEPTHGVVTDDERDEAMRADSAVQQDLAELAVTLTELRQHLLAVWQTAAGPLEKLELSADELTASLVPRPGSSPRRSPAASAPASLASAPVASAASEYRNLLTSFAREWRAEFASLQSMTVSPQSRQILDTHQRLRRTLRNFLFNASRHLVDLRARFEVFQDAPTDATRFHVYQSRLARLLRITQTLHHRFEFTASGIESAWNYRVDAALTAARGLRRRTQARLREIDARLEARAVRRARRQLADNRAEAEQLVARAREALDGKVDQLLTLQARLNKNAALTEGFWTANAEALRQAARWDVLRENEGDTASRLRELAELRAARVGDLTVDLLACGVVEPPVNRNRRIRIAGLGAGLTLLTVLLGQWWITRSR